MITLKEALDLELIKHVELKYLDAYEICIIAEIRHTGYSQENRLERII